VRANGRPPVASPDRLGPASGLTPVDHALVEALQRDGRRTFKQLAADAGVTEKTARRRVLSLLESGTIHITAVTDPRSLGYGAAALLGLTLDGSEPASAVAERLVELPASDYVVVSAGRFALFLELFCRDAAELSAVVDHQVRALPGVGSIEVFPYLSLYYQQATLGAARRKPADDQGVRAVELEPLDRAIIAELTLDGRTPYLGIAESLGVSEAQVRGRMRRMTEAGAVKVIALVNPLRYEYTSTAWLGVRAAPGMRLRGLAEEFSRLSYVTYVAICTGSLDMFVEIICRTPQEMLEVLDEEVRRLPGVQSLEVFQYLDLHYKPLRPPAPDVTSRADGGRSIGRMANGEPDHSAMR
jgi:DNA-binding Lrp family transcriptional regulator